MRRMVLLTAPGGNGHHMWAEILDAAGCQRYGDNELGEIMLPDGPTADYVYWFRSLPSWKWTLNSPYNMVALARDYGYEPFALIPVRDWYCASCSQAKRHNITHHDESWRNMQIGYPFLLNAYWELNVPFILAVYSAAIYNPGYVSWVLRTMGLPDDNIPELRDENKKWYRS